MLFILEKVFNLVDENSYRVIGNLVDLSLSEIPNTIWDVVCNLKMGAEVPS